MSDSVKTMSLVNQFSRVVEMFGFVWPVFDYLKIQMGECSFEILEKAGRYIKYYYMKTWGSAIRLIMEHLLTAISEKWMSIQSNIDYNFGTVMAPYRLHLDVSGL